jgi:hypothetical protein
MDEVWWMLFLWGRPNTTSAPTNAPSTRANTTIISMAIQANAMDS